MGTSKQQITFQFFRSSNKKRCTYRQIIGAFILLLSVLITKTSFANAVKDRTYSLETVGWLQTADNMDGIFSTYVDSIYEKFFTDQKRFQVKSLGRADALLRSSKLPYTSLIQDNDILRRIALQLKVESILRTRVNKEGDSYKFLMEWVYAPKGDVLARHEFRYIDPQKQSNLQGDELPKAIEDGLKKLIGDLPFIGQITGVSGTAVTLNIGRGQGITPGQILVIQTLNDVKRHPLTKTIEEWDFIPVAKLQVDAVDESLMFATIQSVEPNQKVLPYQKVTTVLEAPILRSADGTPLDEAGNEIKEYNFDRIGWAAANLGIGSYVRESGLGDGISGRGGSGWQSTFELEGMAWLNSRFLVESSFAVGLINYSPTNLATGNDIGTSLSGTFTQFRLAAGFSLLEVNNIFDPTLYVKFGNRTSSYSLATDSTNLTGPSSISGWFIGLGLQMPIRDEFGLMFGMDLNLFRSHKQTSPALGKPTADSDLMVVFGGTYRYSQRVLFRVVGKVNAFSADFTSGGSVNQKLFSLCPSVMYTF